MYRHMEEKSDVSFAHFDFCAFLKAFYGDWPLVCGATGALCFGLQMILPMGF